MKLIDRFNYTEKVAPYIDKPVIKIITGMRRVGKSKFLELLQKHIKKSFNNSEILSINMESLEFDFIKNYMDLYKFVRNKFKNSRKKKFLFIDEVQLVEKWEKAINSLFSENIADIFITGSNAYLFSKELATLLSGRYIETEIYPLTFKEFLIFRQKKIMKILLIRKMNLICSLNTEAYRQFIISNLQTRLFMIIYLIFTTRLY